MAFDVNDVSNYDKVQGQSAMGKRLGQKMGNIRCMWSFATLGGAVAGLKMVDCTDGVTTAVIPKGSHITAAFYRVHTTLASGTSTAQVALSLVAANDLTTATVITSGVVWTAGTLPILCTPVKQTASTWLFTTADVSPTLTISVEAVTAGKVVLYLEYDYDNDITAA